MKKVYGIVVIILGAILFIASINSTIKGLPSLLRIKDAQSGGYAFGYLGMSFLFIFLSVWIIEKGGKMLKTKEKSIEEKIKELE